MTEPLFLELWAALHDIGRAAQLALDITLIATPTVAAVLIAAGTAAVARRHSKDRS